VHREDRQIHRIAALGRRQRRIKDPADARAQLVVAAGAEHRKHGQRRAGHEQPVAEVVQTRERHVGRADVQRHEIVAKAAEQRRNDDEEHHQHAVRGDDHVPDMAVGRAFALGCRAQEAGALHAHVLHTGVHQLHAHVDGEGHRDEAHDPRGEQIEDPDVLVIGGHEPAHEEAAPVLVPVSVSGCVGHSPLPLSFVPAAQSRVRPAPFPSVF
jgi:hypothetical protein